MWITIMIMQIKNINSNLIVEYVWLGLRALYMLLCSAIIFELWELVVEVFEIIEQLLIILLY